MRLNTIVPAAAFGLLLITACSQNPPLTSQTSEMDELSEVTATIDAHTENDAVNAQLADIISVKATGDAHAYQFSVEISSPDTGCEQYADWWEVVSEDGELIYRRVLLHSHVDEQPFVRSGGPVALNADTVVWVRAHMNTGGYGGMAFKGSIQAGFQGVDLDPGFAAGLASAPPLPDGCAF